MLIELKIIITKVSRRQWKSSSLYCTVVFLVLNMSLIYRSVKRFISLEYSIAAFELDPRSTPPFEFVFYHQYYLQMTIAISQYFRIMFLMKNLSTINYVKGNNGFSSILCRSFRLLARYFGHENSSFFPFFLLKSRQFLWQKDLLSTGFKL